MQKCSFSEMQHFCPMFETTFRYSQTTYRRDVVLLCSIREHFSIALICQRDIGLTYVVLEKSPNLGWYMQKCSFSENAAFLPMFDYYSQTTYRRDVTPMA